LHQNLIALCFRQISTCDVLNRLAGGLTFVGLFILESGGYRPISAKNSTDSPHQRDDDISQLSISHIRALHCFFPAACVALAGVCLFWYRLNRSEHSKLVKEIDAIDAKVEASATPELEQPTPTSFREISLVSASNQGSILETPATSP
jgi:hypothetical protein